MKRVLLLTVLGATAASWTAWAGDNVWTSLGPDSGGARSLVIDPLNSNTVYALTSAGLAKSTDGGANWGAMPLLQPKPGVVTSLVIDPHNSSTLYAAGAEAWGKGVRALLKSTDEGASWRVLTALNAYGGDPAQLAIDPKDPNTLYAGNSNEILRSTDGGETWKTLNIGLPNRNLLMLAIDPQNPTTVYTVTADAIFKSTNRGADWSAVYSYSEWRPGPQFASLAIDPQDSNTLYAHQAFGGGFYRSSDGGASWRAANSGLPNRQGDSPFPFFPISAVAIHPRNTGTLFAATPDGLFKSTDGAETWSKLDSQPDAGSIRALALDPQNPDAIYASADGSAGGSLHKSTDGGARWRSANSGLRAQGIHHLAFAPQQPAALYADATNWTFASTNQGWLFKSTDKGTSWNNVSSMALLAIDPQNPATVFGIGPHGLEKSTDGGVNWRPAKDGLPEGPCPPRFSSLTIDPQDSRTVYAGLSSCEIGSQNGGVWKSTDGGAGWTKLESKPVGGGVHGLAIDPKTNTLYAWNGNGLSRSTDRGASWSKLGNYYGVTALTIDPQSPGTLYGVYLKGSTPYDDPDCCGVIKSRDGGETWTAVNFGLPRDDLNHMWVDIVTALVIDPRNTSTLYAATANNGVYRTTDGGATWSALNSGLTTMRVFALAVDPQDTGTVYAGTEGGVFTITFTSQ